jgi:uncharacterized protein (TIGR02284 family)
MDNDDIISTLNGLIEICKDGEQGFKTCAEHVSNGYLKTLFGDRSQRCAQSAAELRNLVTGLGGTPTDSSSVASALHRAWIDVKSAVMDRDDEAVLAECERGEDLAVAAYRKALDGTLPIDVRTVVTTQYGGVMYNHDLVKNLREKFGVYQ